MPSTIWTTGLKKSEPCSATGLANPEVPAFNFPLPDAAQSMTMRLVCFHTRPDTLFGASFMAVSADHPVTLELAKSNPQLMAFVEQCRRMGTSTADIETSGKAGL